MQKQGLSWRSLWAYLRIQELQFGGKLCRAWAYLSLPTIVFSYTVMSYKSNTKSSIWMSFQLWTFSLSVSLCTISRNWWTNQWTNIDWEVPVDAAFESWSWRAMFLTLLLGAHGLGDRKQFHSSLKLPKGNPTLIVRCSQKKVDRTWKSHYLQLFISSTMFILIELVAAIGLIHSGQKESPMVR